jgi:hypothetical protein
MRSCVDAVGDLARSASSDSLVDVTSRPASILPTRQDRPNVQVERLRPLDSLNKGHAVNAARV